MAKRGGAEIIGVRIYPVVKRLLEERARGLGNIDEVQEEDMKQGKNGTSAFRS